MQEYRWITLRPPLSDEPPHDADADADDVMLLDADARARGQKYYTSHPPIKWRYIFRTAEKDEDLKRRMKYVLLWASYQHRLLIILPCGGWNLKLPPNYSLAK